MTMLTSLTLSLSVTLLLALTAAAVSPTPTPTPSLCGVPYCNIDAKPCDDRDDGWARLAKEYVRWTSCGSATCPRLNTADVLAFLTSHCNISSIDTPAERDTLDQYSAALGECNHNNVECPAGAACPCSVDEPCRCSDTQAKLDQLISLAEGDCPYASRPIPSLASVMALPTLNTIAGKTVLIIGAGRGNGRAIAKKFAAMGAKVYGTSRLPRAYTEQGIDLSYMQNIASTNGGHQLLQLDTTNSTQMTAFLTLLSTNASIDAANPVDILVLNAGRSIQSVGLDVTTAQTRRLTELLLFGHIDMINMLWQNQVLRASNASRILITGSVAGEIPGAENIQYSGTKRAWHEYGSGLTNGMRNYGVVDVPQIVVIEPTVHCTTIAFTDHPLGDGSVYPELNPPSSGGTSVNQETPNCATALPTNPLVSAGLFGMVPAQDVCRGVKPFYEWWNAGFCCNAPHPVYAPSSGLNPTGVPPGQYTYPFCVNATVVADAFVTVTLLPNPEDRYFTQGFPIFAPFGGEIGLIKAAYQQPWNPQVLSVGATLNQLYYLFGIPCASPCTTQFTPTLPEVDTSNNVGFSYLRDVNGRVRSTVSWDEQTRRSPLIDYALQRVAAPETPEAERKMWSTLFSMRPF